MLVPDYSGTIFERFNIIGENYMKKNIFLFICILFTFNLFAEMLSIDLDDSELPIATKEEYRELIVHDYYTLSYREFYEQAEWVMYVMQPSGYAKRSDDFRSDPMVSTLSATPNDYKNSGYDKGHLAPAADFNFGDDAISQTFFMSNMSPQHPRLNRGSWKNLEEYFRFLSEKFDKVYVITGPILGNDDERENFGSIGRNDVAIPNLYYKCGLFIKDDQYYMIGFIIPNEEKLRPYQHYQEKIDTIEYLTNLDLFSFLLDDIEEELESSNPDLIY